MKRFLIAGAVAVALLGPRGAFSQQTSNAAGAGKTAQPAGKHVPQAKTHPEFNDYNTAYALQGGSVSERAADEFAAKYPDSELKVYLYAKAMHDYQQENNPAKMLSLGNKVLQLDPDNTIALILTATVLADGLSDQDADRQQKVERVKKNTSRALETMDSAFAPPANATPEQVKAFKGTLQSMAHSALGIVALKMNDDARAENELKMAGDLNKAQPDPYIWYHLALAQDHQKKYDEALVSVKRAIQNAASSPDLGELARSEEKRLITLTGGAAPTPAPK